MALGENWEEQPPFLTEYQIRFLLNGHNHDGKNSAFIPRTSSNPPINIPPPINDSIPWGFTGTLIASTSTSPYVPKVNLSVSGFSAILTTPGSTTTTVTLSQNGTVVGTVNLTSGQTYNYELFNPSLLFLARTDIMVVTIQTLGTGAAGLGGGIELQ